MSKPAANRRATNVRQRKKQQQHLLDVKIRASTERRRLIAKIAGISFRLIFATALIAGCWIGGKEGLRRFVFENPDYAVRDIKYVSDGTLTRELVLKTADLSEGRNIFLVNLEQARKEIEKMPQVENAEVTRTLPNRLSVVVNERKPIAWVVSKADDDPTVSDSSFLIDGRGVLMKSRARLEEYLHFPVISGVRTENLVPGERVTTAEMQAALELIRLTGANTRFQARHVDLSKGYCLVVTAHSHAKVTFALEHIDTQLARLHRYLARATEDQKEIQTVNLVVERNTPVTFVEPPPPEGEVVEPPKPPDTKTKAASSSANEKPKSTAPVATPQPVVPRAIPVATPLPSAPPAARPGFFSPIKPKASPTPAAVKAEAIKKQPFRFR